MSEWLFLIFLVLSCAGVCFVPDEWGPYINLAASFTSVISLCILIFTMNKVLRHNRQICRNIKYESAINGLKAYKKQIDDNLPQDKTIPSMLVGQIKRDCETITTINVAIRKEFSKEMKTIKDLNSIVGENYQQISEYLDVIYKAAEKTHE